jgi:APA family basic amino acid/polyamine antiporter
MGHSGQRVLWAVMSPPPGWFAGWASAMRWSSFGFDDRRRGVRGVRAGRPRGRQRVADWFGDRGGDCLLQRDRVRAAGRVLSGLGGTYIYGRQRLGAWWGFTAGWGFLVGKTASCAAMALTFAIYAVPGPSGAQRWMAVAGVLALAALNYRGVARTVMATLVLVAATLVALAVVVAGIAVGLGDPVGRLGGLLVHGHGGLYGVLQSAGLLFFAFAGYARIATMGEEVRDPERTIPRAIPIALAIILAVYLIVGLAALLAAGPDRLANAAAPLVEAMRAVGAGWLAPVVRVGAALASLGALLALIAGVGRTSLAMARHHDLPSWLAGVHPRFRVPHHAEAALAVLVSALVLTADLRGVIGFSSVGVLVYYAIANAAALTLPPGQRRWPRALHVLGIAGCAALITTLPITALLSGLAVLAAGLAGRLVLQGRRPAHIPGSAHRQNDKKETGHG